MATERRVAVIEPEAFIEFGEVDVLKHDKEGSGWGYNFKKLVFNIDVCILVLSEITYIYPALMSWHGNTFHITDPLRRDSTSYRLISVTQDQ